MRAHRLLSILLLLQAHGRLTARALAQRLEVSERTIHRDMDALSAAGVPVYAERGTGGGWSVTEGYRARLPGLSEAEIQALFLAAPTRLLADLGLRQASEAALLKLLTVLPDLARRDVEYARQRIHVDPTGWYETAESVAALPALQEAVWQERQVCMSYERSDGTAVERLVDPLGLVAKGRVWYLVAAVEGDLRTYRVSRVREARLTDQPCRRPVGFDLAAYWAQATTEFKASIPRYQAIVRVGPALLRSVRKDRIEQAGAPDADGWTTLTLRFDVEEEACQHILGFGAEMEVMAPAALREKVTVRAAEVAAFYARGSPPPTATSSQP